MPHEYENTSGQIVLDCAKAIQESVFEDFRVVRDGQLRLIFSRDLKVVSYQMASMCLEFQFLNTPPIVRHNFSLPLFC